MTPGQGEGKPSPRLVDLRQLVVQLGTAMVAAGDAVDIIEASLRRVIDAYGVNDVQIALLPTSLFVETGVGRSAHVQFTSQVAEPLRLDQISALYELVKELELGQLAPAEGLQRLADVSCLRPPSADG
jgi:uncharacterized membrane protein YjjP (DUF1212 family)